MRMRSCVLVLLVLALGGASELMACQAMLDTSALEKLNDDTIKAAVQGKLTADNIQNLAMKAFAQIEVEAERGSVTLNGVVPTAEQKVRAEQLAGEVNGVKEITNNLKVQPAKRR